MVPFVVQPGGSHVGVPQPFLHLGDVGAVQQGVGRRRSPQRMHTKAAHSSIDPDLLAVAPHHILVDRSRVQRLVQCPGSVIPDRAKQWSRQIVSMSGHVQIGLDQPRGFGRDGNKPDLATLAFDAELQHAFPLLEIADPQLTQLFNRHSSSRRRP